MITCCHKLQSGTVEDAIGDKIRILHRHFPAGQSVTKKLCSRAKESDP